jgi:hypothetical protein
MTQVPTTDQIRHAIDSGATGEKVGFPDPATAPLGTDAEAGGIPPTHAERAIEADAQIEYREPVPWNGPLIYFVLIAAVAVGIVMIGTLALRP